MNALDVIRQVEAHGGRLAVERGELKVRAPEPLPEQLLAALSTDKPAVLVALGLPLDHTIANVLKDLRPHLSPALQAARQFQARPAFGEYRRLRQVVEHRIARLVQLGIRQARYFGGAKTLFQLCMAAAVANLTLLAYRAAQGTKDPDSLHLFVLLVAVGLLTWSQLAVAGRRSAWASSSGRNRPSDLGDIARAA